MKKYRRKLHRYKRKKSIFCQRFLWLGILTLMLAGGIFYSLCFLEVFQVKKIIVSGNDNVSKEDIEFLVGQRIESKLLFFKTKTIFAVGLNQIKKDILNQYPQIAEAEVSRGFFDAINVAVAERQGVACWCQEKCFLIDKEGIIFKETSEIQPGLILIKAESGLTEPQAKPGEKAIDEKLLSKIFEISSKLAEAAKIVISEVSPISEERLNMKTNEGWEIYFNLKGDWDWQTTELALVLEKQIPAGQRNKLEYIDLRFSRVYYKYRP